MSGYFGGGGGALSTALAVDANKRIVQTCTGDFTGSAQTGAAYVINCNASATPGPNLHLPGLHVVGADNTYANLYLDSYGSVSGAARAILGGSFSNGTAASPTAVQSADEMFRIRAEGRAATKYSGTTACISFVAKQNYTDTANGTAIDIKTTALGVAGQSTDIGPATSTTFQPSGAVTVGDATFNATDPGNGYLAAKNGLLVGTGGVPYVLARSSVESAVHTGDTNLTTFATVAVPGNTLGANGRLRITVLYRFTGVAGAKTPTVTFGGVTFGSIASSAANLSWNAQVVIANRNATNSQICQPLGASSFTVSSNDIVTAAIDTTASQNVVFQGQLANAGDSIAVESYLIEVIP